MVFELIIKCDDANQHGDGQTELTHIPSSGYLVLYAIFWFTIRMGGDAMLFQVRVHYVLQHA